MSLVDSKGWQGGVASIVQTRPSVVTVATTAPTTAMTTTRRNMGGRRPAKNSGVCTIQMIHFNVQLHRIPFNVGSLQKATVADFRNSIFRSLQRRKRGEECGGKEIRWQQHDAGKGEWTTPMPCCR